jgi:hypothetical protein
MSHPLLQQVAQAVWQHLPGSKPAHVLPLVADPAHIASGIQGSSDSLEHLPE